MTRLNMTLNAKTILSAVGIAAALASPAVAKTHHQTPSQVTVPADARGSADHRAGYDAPAQTVYAPDVPTPAHNNGLNPDFQLSIGE
jgi:hypothetical protein